MCADAAQSAISKVSFAGVIVVVLRHASRDE